MNDIVVFDGNNIAFRAWKAMESDPLTNDGLDVSAIYGFFRTISYLLANNDIRAEKVVVAWDYGRSSYRSNIYPEYKGTREHDDSFTHFIRQLNEIQTMLNYLPIYQLKVHHVEADDLIGALCQLYPGQMKIIVSGDKDLSQFVDEKTFMYKLGMYANQHMFITPNNFEKLYSKCSVPFNKVIDYKVVMGDTSDNIGKVIGVGDKGMENLFKTCGSLPNAIDMYLKDEIEDKKLLKVMSKIIRDRELIYLNYKLVDIQYAITDEIVKYVNDELSQTKYPSTESFKNELIRLNFNSLLAKFEDFILTLNT